MRKIDELSMLLPGQGIQSFDRLPVGTAGSRGWFARAVVSAVTRTN